MGDLNPTNSNVLGEDSPSVDSESRRVKLWRHRMQKLFLSRPSIRVEDMPSADKILKEIEQYEDMKAEYLNYSKLGKVMRHIRALPSDLIPREDEYHFRDRAFKLLAEWDVLLQASTSTNPSSSQQNHPPPISSTVTNHLADDVPSAFESSATPAECLNPTLGLGTLAAGPSRPLPSPPAVPPEATSPVIPTEAVQASTATNQQDRVLQLHTALDSDPEAQRAKRWRQFLQKKFLTPGRKLDSADAFACDAIFTTMEQYENMTQSYLDYSKIRKVLRYISLLPTEQIPNDHGFYFQSRAKDLFERWRTFSSPNTAPPIPDHAPDVPPSPTQPDLPLSNPAVSAEPTLTQPTTAEERLSHLAGTSEPLEPYHPAPSTPPAESTLSRSSHEPAHEKPCRELDPPSFRILSPERTVSRDSEPAVEDNSDSDIFLDAPSETSGEQIDFDGDGEASPELLSDAEPFSVPLSPTEDEDPWVLVDAAMEGTNLS